MQTLLILRSVPGAGKSTLARTLADRSNGTVAIVSADNYMTSASGAYCFDPARLPECHARAYEDAEAFLRDGTALVIVDNTNTTQAEVARWLALAERYVVVAQVVTVENWHGGHSRHGVPHETLKRMAKSLRNSMELG